MELNIDAFVSEMSLPLLPDVIVEICESIGYERALKLITTLGGLDFAMPTGADRSRRAQTLIDAVGEQAAVQLMQDYGGSRLYIPRCHALMVRMRNRQFVADVQALVRTGLSQTAAIQQLAPQYGFSERWAYEVLSHEPKPVQLDMFD